MRTILLGGQGCNIWAQSMHQRPPPPSRAGRRIAGWTEDAARSNRAFLLSVDPRGLSGDLGYAVTLTLAATPATSGEWTRAINHFLVTMRRAGVTRYHWVTEWTEKGRPHLHASLFWAGRDPVQPLPQGYQRSDALAHLRRGRAGPTAWDGWAGGIPGFMGRIVGPGGRHEPLGALGTPVADWYTDQVHADAIFAAWIRVTAQDLSPHAQHIERIRDMGGWSSYTAKHAARGVNHYQRQTLKLPSGWTTSGRLWARGGKWPIRSDRYQTDDVTAWRMRRGLRRWLRARVKAKLAQVWGNSLAARKKRKQLRRELRHVTGHRRAPEDFRDVRGVGQERAWSEVVGFTTFAPLVVQDAIWEWAMSHPDAEVIDLETGEVLRAPSTPLPPITANPAPPDRRSR